MSPARNEAATCASAGALAIVVGETAARRIRFVSESSHRRAYLAAGVVLSRTPALIEMTARTSDETAASRAAAGSRRKGIGCLLIRSAWHGTGRADETGYECSAMSLIKAEIAEPTAFRSHAALSQIQPARTSKFTTAPS